MRIARVNDKVGHKVPITHDSESIFGSRRYYSTVFRPIDKNVTSVGRCRESTVSAFQIGTSTAHFAAFHRIGRSCNDIKSRGTVEMKNQTFIRVIIQFVMVFSGKDRKTRDAGIVFNSGSMVIQFEGDLFSYAVIIEGEFNKRAKNFCRIHQESMSSAFIAVDKGTDLKV